MDSEDVHVDDAAGRPKPQALLLTFLGAHLLGRDVLVSTSSVIDALGRVGVSEHAARSTLSRMARRGLLDRVRRGRQVYVGLTPRSREILEGGNVRIWHTSVVDTRWDGTWTLLSFSLPESWQRQRHALRTRLLWSGFGPLQGGLWIAPSAVDVHALAADLEAAEHLKIFSARALPPTDVDGLVRDAWDLEALAARYRAFINRWGRPERRPSLPDDFSRHLMLQCDWLQVIRRDPRLPARHLPPDWPAEHAQRLFRELDGELATEARRIAREVLDVLPASGDLAG
jgi:phenylacetic acid degradation operon negative regulatory protein